MNKKVLLIICIVFVAVLAVFTVTTFSKKGAYDNTNGITTPEPVLTDTNKLTGQTWVWLRTELSDGRVVTPKKVDEFSLSFNKYTEGEVVGTTDCNSFSGTYTTWGDRTISFGMFISTEMACGDSQEEVFRTAVYDSNQYMFDSNGNLILLIKYDSGSVIFRKK